MSRNGLLQVENTRIVTVRGSGQILVYNSGSGGGGGGNGNGGSLLFDPAQSAQLTVPAGSDWAFGTGDFTLEWWQQQTDSSSFPRIFSVDTYPSADIGVSIEGGTFYVWTAGSANSFGSAGSYKNQWVHFAVTRNGTSLRAFKNGTQLGTTITNSANINNTTDTLYIGSEAGNANTFFGGNLTNFHIIKGTAKYTSGFTVPSSPISADANSKLLLLATSSGTYLDDDSGQGKTVTNPSSLVTWSSSNPFA